MLLGTTSQAEQKERSHRLRQTAQQAEDETMTFRDIKNYICYCGIEKEEYNALKKDAYRSNFMVWRALHLLMAVVFGVLLVSTLFNDLVKINRVYYLAAFLYSAAAVCLFFILKEDSLAAQLIIYLSISMLFLFGGLITQNKPDIPATTFIAMLLITPMFMIDKPFFMAIELCAADAVFLVWMHSVKTYEIWRYDVINVVIFTFVGIFLHIIANSIRIREFVLTRKINIQKDTDELTGLRNKAALTREINEFIGAGPAGRGVMFLMDVDRFKLINDTYGHDAGDRVMEQLGSYLRGRFTGNEIVGRFGGDEFVVFLKDTDDVPAACRIAGDVIRGVSENVSLPDSGEKVGISIGIAAYTGDETNYSGIFKKADMAMYKAKADPERKYCVYS